MQTVLGRVRPSIISGTAASNPRSGQSSIPVRSRNTECTGAWNSRRCKSLGLLPFLPYEMIPFAFEQYIETGQTAIDTGNVLLEVDFFPVVQIGTAVDLLLHYPD